MYTPSREKFVQAAEHGNLIPVYREIFSDGETPVSAYAKLGEREYGFLLESVVGGEKWASYSFIGVAPRAVLSWRNGRAHVRWYDVEGGGTDREASWEAADPTAALAEVMGEWNAVEMPGLPRFWGGAVGWISYDAVRSFEDLPTSTSGDDELPALCMVMTDTLIIFDNLRQTMKVVAAPYVPRPSRAAAAYDKACARIDAVVQQLRSSTSALREMSPPPVLHDTSAEVAHDVVASARWGGGAMPESSFGETKFLAAVGRVKEYILAGDAFQTVLSQRFKLPRDGLDPFDLYRALRVVNPSPYMFHLAFPEAQVTGASPETLVRCEGNVVEVRPIAGTRPRGRTPAEDADLARELKQDTKECAEHLMLIDLGRNDVGRVAQIGSVEVTECMNIERYSHVMHMVSHVRGTLREDLTWHDALRAAFPAGTLSGAPKIRAMEIIEELEPHRRGIYGGAVGYVSYSGNLDLAIAIRTVVTRDENIYVQAGAGLVYDSDPKAEYEECLNKARAALRAVHMARAAGQEQ